MMAPGAVGVVRAVFRNVPVPLFVLYRVSAEPNVLHETAAANMRAVDSTRNLRRTRSMFIGGWW